MIRKSEESKLKERMKHYKKIHHEKKIEEKYELKEYMKSLNLKRARMKFALESEMVQQIKFNYMSDKKYEKSNWACDFCLEIKKKYNPDSITHAINCEGYQNLRKNANLENEVDMIDYFIKIVKIRNDLNHDS